MMALLQVSAEVSSYKVARYGISFAPLILHPWNLLSLLLANTNLSETDTLEVPVAKKVRL